MQDLAKRLAADVGKISLAQDLLQQGKRPRRCLILFAIWFPLDFGEHPPSLLARRGRLAATPACGLSDCKPTLVQSENHLSHCLSAQARFLPRCCQCGSCCHRQQRLGLFHGIQTPTRCFHDPLQFFPLFFLQFS